MPEPSTVGILMLIQKLLSTVSNRGKRLDKKVVEELNDLKSLVTQLAVIVSENQSKEFKFRTNSSDRLHTIESRIETIESKIN